MPTPGCDKGTVEDHDRAKLLMAEDAYRQVFEDAAGMFSSESDLE